MIKQQPLARTDWQCCQFLNTRQYPAHWIFILIIILAFLGKPTVGLASMCIDWTPDQLIRETDLIFKGKVIGSKILFLDKFDVTDAFKRIWSRNDIDEWGKSQELLKAVKPYADAKDFNELAGKPDFWRDFIYSRTTFKILVPYKGPILDEIEIEIENHSGDIGEEKMVFAYGNIREGYRSVRCTGSSYFYPDNETNRQPYQAALDNYRNHRDRLASALSQSPHNAELLKEQGALYLQYHDFDVAQWSYAALRWHHPNDWSGLIGLADVTLNRATHDYPKDKKSLYEQALTTYRSVLKLAPNNHAARHGETLALLYLDRWSEVDKNARDFSGYIYFKGVGEHDESMDFFVGRNLSRASFRNAKLYHVNFSRTALSHADFSGADVSSCDFTDATLTQAIFHELHDSYNTKFVGAKLQRADFTKATLESADFSHANLQGAKFIEARLTNANLNTADLRWADLSKAELYGNSWGNAKISKTKFTDAKACGFDATSWPVGFDLNAAGIKACK